MKLALRSNKRHFQSDKVPYTIEQNKALLATFSSALFVASVTFYPFTRVKKVNFPTMRQLIQAASSKQQAASSKQQAASSKQQAASTLTLSGASNKPDRHHLSHLDDKRACGRLAASLFQPISRHRSFGATLPHRSPTREESSPSLSCCPLACNSDCVYPIKRLRIRVKPGQESPLSIQAHQPL